jgi:phosphoribosylaminoimidazole carboxylase
MRELAAHLDLWMEGDEQGTGGGMDGAYLELPMDALRPRGAIMSYVVVLREDGEGTRRGARSRPSCCLLLLLLSSLLLPSPSQLAHSSARMTTDCNPFDTVVGLLGGGQLGRMLLQAASPLSIPILVLDPAVASPAKQIFAPSLHALSSAQAPLRHLDGQFTDAASIRELAAQVDVITIEIEHVDVTALEAVEQEFAAAGGRSGKGVKVYPASRVVRIIQDKFLQKEHLAARGIAVAPFRQITCDGDDTLDVQALVPSILAAGDAFGYPLMLKSRHLAYDGKGNYVLPSSSPSDIAAALAALVPTASLPTAAKPGHPLRNRLYAEKFAAFSMEVAVMVVRGVSGETRAYEPVETVHRENVCHIVYSPLRPRRGANEGVGNAQRGDEGATDVAARARSMAEAAISALGDGAVGVFGVEMFLMKDGSPLFFQRRCSSG